MYGMYRWYTYEICLCMIESICDVSKCVCIVYVCDVYRKRYMIANSKGQYVLFERMYVYLYVYVYDIYMKMMLMYMKMRYAYKYV